MDMELSFGFRKLLHIDLEQTFGFEPVGLIADCPFRKKDVNVNMVRSRMRAFWLQIAPRVLASVSNTSIIVWLKSIQVPKYTPTEENIKAFTVMPEESFTVDFTEEVNEIVKLITKESILKFFVKHYMDANNCCILSFEITSKEHWEGTLDTYVSTTVHQALMTDNDISEEQKFYDDFRMSSKLWEKMNIYVEIAENKLKDLKSPMLDSNLYGLPQRAIVTKDFREFKSELQWKDLQLSNANK